MTHPKEQVNPSSTEPSLPEKHGSLLDRIESLATENEKGRVEVRHLNETLRLKADNLKLVQNNHQRILWTQRFAIVVLLVADIFEFCIVQKAQTQREESHEHYIWLLNSYERHFMQDAGKAHYSIKRENKEPSEAEEDKKSVAS